MPSRVSRRLLLVVGLVAAVAFPLGVVAGHRFTDVPDSNAFHDHIDAIADAGVTTGCGVNLYCPKAFVTREQMAAFLNRLGALGPGTNPVVNADKVDGIDDVMPGGDIVTVHAGGWLVGLGTDFTIGNLAAGSSIATALAAEGDVLLPLPTPVTIGGQEYGIASVEICFSGAAGFVITNTIVTAATAGGSGHLINDPTDRATTSDACYTVTNLTPTVSDGGLNVVLTIDFAMAHDFIIGNVTTTWTPVG